MKNKWLELYEEGKTEKQIARDADCDVRTVRKAINEIRLKRDVAVARVELVKDALRKHQDSLLEELAQILFSLTVPQRDFAVLSWHHGEESVFSETSDMIRLERGSEGTMRRLLKEHLKHDRIWKVLAQWEKANVNHQAARVALQRKTADLLQKETGYKLVDNDGSPPFVYSYTTGPLLYKSAIDFAYTAPEDIDLEKAIENFATNIIINTDSGDVRSHDHSILAVAPGSEARTKQNLLNAFRDLVKSPEIEPIVPTYKVLEQITKISRQVVEEIRLLGLIPGQCEVCRRLGM
jgi:hypothetical protein